LTSAATVVVVVVVVVVEIISTLVVVAVGRGGDYLDTSSSNGSSGSISREISCSEAVLWTTNCPLVLACSGLGERRSLSVVTLLF
jgi:hypothetical protein